MSTLVPQSVAQGKESISFLVKFSVEDEFGGQTSLQVILESRDDGFDSDRPSDTVDSLDSVDILSANLDEFDETIPVISVLKSSYLISNEKRVKLDSVDASK